MEYQTLVLFTLHYPYCKVSETFLNPEIEVLSKRFSKVLIVPWKKEVNDLIALPENVSVSHVLLDLEFNKSYLLLLLKRIKYWGLFLKIYLYSIFNDRPIKPYFYSAYYLYNLINSIERYLILKDFIELNHLGNAVFYDYWFENSTLSLAILKKRNIINKLYSRSHGFDVFDERWASGIVPFRSFKLSSMDAHFTISEYNKRYICQRIKKRIQAKIFVSYLGVRNQFPLSEIKSRSDIEPYIIVSSANLLDFKRVHLIPELLNLIGLPIIWYHFGDGPMRELLLSNAENLNSDIEFKFMGHVEHQVLMDFYKMNKLDLSISLSIKEGLPVSMMEAMSFGIPLVGYNVFGVPEIIDKTTGLLFDLGVDFEYMALGIRNLLLLENLKPSNIIEAFNKKFNAESNYNSLADLMTKNY